MSKGIYWWVTRSRSEWPEDAADIAGLCARAQFRFSDIFLYIICVRNRNRARLESASRRSQNRACFGSLFVFAKFDVQITIIVIRKMGCKMDHAKV